MQKHFLSSLFLLAALVRVQAQPTELDLSFGTDGKAGVSLGGSWSHATSIAVQPDGRILAAGTRTDNATYTTNSYLVRFLPDGGADSSFAGTGVVQTPLVFEQSSYAEKLMALQPDGKVLVAGRTKINGDFHLALVRYLADGSLDADFGENGLAKININANSPSNSEIAYALLLLPDGKIIAAGSSDGATPSGTDFILARFRPDGSIDTGFGTDGIAAASITSSFDYVHNALLQPDGKVLVSGSAGLPFGSSRGMARFNADGSLDTGFGNNGILKEAGPSGNNLVHSLALQADGKILRLVVDQDAQAPFYKLMVQRFTESGAVDTGYGIDGRVDFPAGDQLAENDGALALLPDGALLVVAKRQNERLVLIRLLDDGSKDPGFGVNGIAESSLAFFAPRTVVEGPLGTILVGGGASFSLARFGELPSGVPVAHPATLPSVEVYPNPAHAYFEVGHGEAGWLTVSDAFGRRLFSAAFTPGRPVDCSAWPAGFYTVLLATERGAFSGRLLKH